MNSKQTFLLQDLEIMAWGASVQRAGIYAKDAKETDKIQFRKMVVEHINAQLIPKYNKRVSEEYHLSNIESVIKEAKAHGQDVLKGGNYNFGIAQKLLNLLLKYHWCLGFISEPPHCPVDRIIINETRLRGKVNWTQMTTQEQYMEVIEAMWEKAKGKDLANWELEEYKRVFFNN